MFIIFQNPNVYMKKIFAGYEQDDVMYQNEFSGIFHKLHHVHTARSLNKKVNLPFKWIWYKHYLDYRKIEQCRAEGEEIYFVFFEGNRQAYDQKFISYLRSRLKEAKFVFRYINVLNQYNNIYFPYVKENFDIILSMEKADCQKYGMTYVHNTYYYHVQKKNIQGDACDVLFLGENKNRYDLLCQIYERFSKQGLTCEFYISNVPQELQHTKHAGIHFINHMEYDDYISKVIGAKAILEIVSENQKGSTLRALEAAYFDKYLITNNRSIVDEDFYSEEAVIFYGDMSDGAGTCLDTGNVKWENKRNVGHRYLFDKIKNLNKSMGNEL